MGCRGGYREGGEGEGGEGVYLSNATQQNFLNVNAIVYRMGYVAPTYSVRS